MRACNGLALHSKTGSMIANRAGKPEPEPGCSFTVSPHPWLQQFAESTDAMYECFAFY